MNVRHPFTFYKNVFYEKMDLGLFYFRVTRCNVVKGYLFFSAPKILSLQF